MQEEGNAEDEIMELLSPANESEELEEAAEEGYKMTEALALFWDDAAGVRD